MFAGGTEAAISPAGVAGFASMKALCADHNDDPAHGSRPFDKNRSGFIMGEGAGIIILEKLEHALNRGLHQARAGKGDLRKVQPAPGKRVRPLQHRRGARGREGQEADVAGDRCWR